MAQVKVNKHGYVMSNLRDICSLTKGMRSGSSYHIEIAYLPSYGRISYEEHVGPVGNSCVVWSDDVIPCGYLSHPMSQQEIADQVASAISDYHRRRS